MPTLLESFGVTSCTTEWSGNDGGGGGSSIAVVVAVVESLQPMLCPGESPPPKENSAEAAGSLSPRVKWARLFRYSRAPRKSARCRGGIKVKRILRRNVKDWYGNETTRDGGREKEDASNVFVIIVVGNSSFSALFSAEILPSQPPISSTFLKNEGWFLPIHKVFRCTSFSFVLEF